MHDCVTISNDFIELAIEPEIGARVMSLVDRRNGRNWMKQGQSKTGWGDDPSYISGPPAGWDECFPTIAVCDDPDWGGSLRDHGELWGRPWTCEATPDAILATYSEPRFRFERRLSLSGPRVVADYTVTSTAPRALPFLWSQHCLLDCRPGERFVADGIGEWTDRHGGRAVPGPVLPETSGLVDKYVAPVHGGASVALAGPTGEIRFTWDGTALPFVGLWVNYGGWPEDRPGYQVAIEPTTSSAGALSDARLRGDSSLLLPGASIAWTVTIDLVALGTY